MPTPVFFTQLNTKYYCLLLSIVFRKLLFEADSHLLVGERGSLQLEPMVVGRES